MAHVNQYEGNIISHPHDVAFIRKTYESMLITIKETRGSKGADGVSKNVSAMISGKGR